MKRLFTLVCICCTSTAKAQERIDTDRPDQTESAVTVPLHFLQAELGFNRESYTDGTLQWVHPTGLLKYGFHKRAELRLEASIITVHDPEKENAAGFEPLSIGTKIALWEEKGLLPKTSVIASVGLPFLSGKTFRTPGFSPLARLTLQHTLSKVAALGYNVGISWDGVENVPTWFYTFSPSINIGKRWYAYIEAFGFLHQGVLPEHNFDAGVAYYISNDLKLDASGGIGVATSTLKNYAALGCSFRFRAVKDRASQPAVSTGAQ